MNRLVFWVPAFAFISVSTARGIVLSVEPASPVRGEVAAIRVFGDATADTSLAAREAARTGWKGYVEYFPNSKVARDDTLGVTGPAGEVFWEPAFAGIVAVRAIRKKEGGSPEQLATNVSVRFPSVPAGGVLVFLTAGFVLLGGAGWAFVHLLEHKPPGEGRSEPEA